MTPMSNTNQTKSMRWISTPVLIVAAAILACATTSLQAQGSGRTSINYRPDARYTGQALWDVAKVKEENMDIGLWALIISKTYDSTVDVPEYLAMLDSWAAEIRRMLADRTKDMDKLLAVRTFLYEPGPWNGGRVWEYDTVDFGLGVDHPELRLLSHYMKTRKGNCVSMPTLFLALMERIDPNLQLFGATIPMHVFCRYYDRQTKDQFNVETTAGGLPERNEHLLDIMPVNQIAIDKGTYFRNLTKREFVACLTNIVEGKAAVASDFKLCVKYGELMMKIAPKHVTGYITKLVAVTHLWDTLHGRVEKGMLLNEADWAECKRLGREMKALRKKVDDMAWEPVPEGWDQRYTTMIRAGWARRAQMEERERMEAQDAGKQ